MGYQVGNMCFSTKQQAENHYFSLVVPQILPDGKIMKPEYLGGQWKMNGEVLQANLPQCSPIQNFRDGAKLGSGFLLIAVTLMMTVLITRMMR